MNRKEGDGGKMSLETNDLAGQPKRRGRNRGRNRGRKKKYGQVEKLVVPLQLVAQFIEQTFGLFFGP